MPNAQKTIYFICTDIQSNGVCDAVWMSRIGQTSVARMLSQRHESLIVSSTFDMVNQIVNRIQTNENQGAKIGALYINGHGSPTCQSVGCGMSPDREAVKCIMAGPSIKVSPTFYVCPKLLGDAETHLARLRPFFAHSGIVVMSGCDMLGVKQEEKDGSDFPLPQAPLQYPTKGGLAELQAWRTRMETEAENRKSELYQGQAFLRKIASIVGVQVEGGVGLQSSIPGLPRTAWRCTADHCVPVL